MRVTYIYQYFTTPAGAYSTRAFEFTRRWVEQGADVTVVTSAFDKSDLRSKRLFDCVRIAGAQVRLLNLLDSNQQSFFRRVLSSALYACFASFHAVFGSADVVVCSSGPLFVGLPGLLAKWIRGRPFVFEVRDLWPEGAIQLGVLRHPILIWCARFFEKLCYQQAAAIVALSPDSAKWISELTGRNDLLMIPNASDNDSFPDVAVKNAERDRGMNASKIIYAGSLGRMNDSMQLIELAHYLKEIDPNLRIDVYGSGKDLPNLREKKVKEKLDNIEFFGLRPKPEVFDALQSASCAVIMFDKAPVLDCVSPNKLFDAFAAGLPVVQTTQGWIKTLVAEEKCGLTVDRGDMKGVAVALSTIVNDSDLQANMSINAQKLAKSRFDRNQLALDYMSLLESLAIGTKDREPSSRPGVLQ